MKVRLLPVAISLVVTLIVLFGGWSLYEWLQVKQPISHVLENEAHIKGYNMNVTPNQVTVDLDVEPEFSLAGDYLVLLDQLRELSGQENVTLTIKDASDSELQTTWHELYVVLADGIANREYSTMVEKLQQSPLAKGVNVQVAMDSEHVYVWLQKNDTTTLFRALPLHAVEAEVPAHA